MYGMGRYDTVCNLSDVLGIEVLYNMIQYYTYPFLPLRSTDAYRLCPVQESCKIQ